MTRHYQFVEFDFEDCVYDFLKKRCEQNPEKTALVDAATGRKWSYKQLLVSVEKLASFFLSRGVSEGSRVSLHVDNSVEAYFCLAAIASIPAIAVFIRPSLKFREVRQILIDSESRAIITDDGHDETVNRILKDDPLTNTIQARFVIGQRIMAGFESISNVLFGDTNRTENTFKPGRVDCPQEHVVIMSPTSGTSGMPKLVEHTHRSFLAGFYISSGPYVRCFDTSDTILGWNNITHVSGMWQFGCSVLVGATVVVTKYGTVTNFRELKNICRKFQITAMMAFPTAFNRILMDARGDPLEGVRSIIVAGSVPPPSIRILCKRWLPDLKQLRNLYGQSEAMVPVSLTPVDGFELTTSGYPVSNLLIRIIDRSTNMEVENGQIGECEYNGPNIMKGYYRNQEATNEVITPDGWCKTGDLGFINTQGCLVILERIKEMIKCLDNQLPPAEIENLLMENEAVKEVAVVGVPHEKYGEAPTAFVVLKTSHEGSEQLKLTLTRSVEDQLAYFKRLYGGVFFVEQLPKTDSGKIARRLLREKVKEFQ